MDSLTSEKTSFQSRTQPMTLMMSEQTFADCEGFEASFAKHNIHTTTSPLDGGAFLKELVDKEPDVALLEVFMPGLDALSVKQNFDLRRQGSNMVFFATGPFFSDGIIKELMDCGFVYYFMKPFHPDALSRQIVSMRFAGPKSHVPNSSVHKATWILRDLGMPAHLLGFHYVRQAITLVAEDHGRYGVGMITRKLYPDIAEQNKSSASKVERAIRHAIEVVFDRSPPDKIEKYFGSTVGENRGKTTNSEFIMMLVDQIALSGGNPQIISSGVWM